jgi:hypothetical protein
MRSSIRLAKEFLNTQQHYHIYTEALLRAAKCGHAGTIMTFIRLGADVHAHGDLALCMAAACSHEGSGRYIAAILDGCGANWSNAIKTARQADREDIAKQLERWWPDVYRSRVWPKGCESIAARRGQSIK